jgi:hypothetical protein
LPEEFCYKYKDIIHYCDDARYEVYDDKCLKKCPENYKRGCSGNTCYLQCTA